MELSKKNVAEFNDDVRVNEGYRYTTNAPISSILSNLRISDAVGSYVLPEYGTLADIGCGDGTYTSEFKQQFPNLAVEGFDPASDAILLAQKKYPEIIFSVRNILSDDIVSSTHQFDVGVLRGVLHHLTDQKVAIRNALQISGTLIIVEPNGNNPILKIIEKVSLYHREHEEQSYTYWQLKSWCEEVGGRVVRHEYVGFVPFFCPAPLARAIHFFQPLLERIPVVREFLSAQIILVCEKAQQPNAK